MPNIDYQPPVSELLTYGRPKEGSRDRWFDYVDAYGLTTEHIPSLIRLASEENLNWEDEVECYAPVHAFRALGQLKAETAIQPLIDLLSHEDDDWFMEELPRVFGMIGLACIPKLTDYLTVSQSGCWSKTAAADGLAKIATSHPDHRDECVQILAQALARHGQQEAELNGSLVAKLLELNAVEAVGIIEKAYKEGPMDEMICGSLAMVKISLGFDSAEDFTPEELQFKQPEWMKPIQEMAATLELLSSHSPKESAKSKGLSLPSFGPKGLSPINPQPLKPKSGFGSQQPKKKKKKR
ncbi:MAG: DUF1186 domain-containing protein [Thermosynechococcaceae cyanobacterium]